MTEGMIVQLREDVLQRHSRSVPAHAGFSTQQFAWRDTLRKYLRTSGVITRVFDKSVNVRFPDGVTIGINTSEVIPRNG